MPHCSSMTGPAPSLPIAGRARRSSRRPPGRSTERWGPVSLGARGYSAMCPVSLRAAPCCRLSRTGRRRRSGSTPGTRAAVTSRPGSAPSGTFSPSACKVSESLTRRGARQCPGASLPTDADRDALGKRVRLALRVWVSRPHSPRWVGFEVSITFRIASSLLAFARVYTPHFHRPVPCAARRSFGPIRPCWNRTRKTPLAAPTPLSSTDRRASAWRA